MIESAAGEPRATSATDHDGKGARPSVRAFRPGPWPADQSGCRPGSGTAQRVRCRRPDDHGGHDRNSLLTWAVHQPVDGSPTLRSRPTRPRLLPTRRQITNCRSGESEQRMIPIKFSTLAHPTFGWTRVVGGAVATCEQLFGRPPPGSIGDRHGQREQFKRRCYAALPSTAALTLASQVSRSCPVRTLPRPSLP